jgi:hypothetical protein
VSRIVQPSIDEFELVGNVVTHLPTQARWTAYEGSRTPHHVHRGSLGKVLPNGDEYYPEEVAIVALKLLAGRVKPSDA